GALVVVLLLAREDRVAEGLIVALETDHLPPPPAVVAAVLGHREAALEGVLDHEVEEGNAAAGVATQHGRAVEHGENLVLFRLREAHKWGARHHPRDLVHARESRPVDVAQPRERSERRVVEVGAGYRPRAEQLGAPA